MEQVETEISKFENEEEERMEEEEEEKKKKLKKVGRKEKKKKEEHLEMDIPTLSKVRPPEVEPALQIPGLKNLKLTSLTQKIMGCIVGEHVTAESPWTTINKVVVDENLYLHHESSDFLPIKDDLAEYSDTTILVGYDPNYMPFEDEDFHRFYIAVTEAARDEVLFRLNEEKRLTEERLRNSIHKKVLPWLTLGSEKEVDDSIVRNTRPLIQLELETDIDELLKPVNFKDRNVEDAKDGYVRIGPGRHHFVGIPKARVDTSVQAVPKVLPNVAQTDPGLPTNAWTQYLYDMTTANEALENSAVKELKPDYVFAEKDYLEKALEYNEHFDLYVNDYPLLVLQEKDQNIPRKSIFEEYEAYTDVSHCKNKLISAIAWHPMWSGIVALSYAVAVRCVTSAEVDVSADEVSRDVFSKNYVLLWSFKDALKPRLVLESPREVHSIAWSPIDPHILVGGCASGQIIVWDLNGKLEAVEGHEYLTPDQQRYRLVMQTLIGWLQPQPPAQYVRPAALSNLQYSHSGRISHVQWLPPQYEWTENGHYVKVEVEQGKASMQILSCGEDGVVMVWDLNKIPEDVGAGSRVRKRKIRKRPSALTAQISPFKIFDRKIRPIYILSPELPNYKTATRLTSLSIEPYPIAYKLSEVDTYGEVRTKVDEDVMKDREKSFDFGPKISESTKTVTEDSSSDRILNKRSDTESVKREENKLKFTDSLEDVNEDSITFRKIYRPVIEQPRDDPVRLINVTTDEGDTVTLSWDGFDFHKGEEITTELGRVHSWGASVHDGPVVACARSPFIPDLLLTVGGKVIAMWNPELPNQPLFWKYSSVILTCATWSPYRPCLFHVGRSDGSLEVWDITRYSDSPTIVQSISGKVLTSIAEHSLPLHGNTCVLGIADFNKSFRLLYFPEEYKIPKPRELESLRNFVKREIYLRLNYAEWNESFIKSNAEELEKMKAREEEAEKKRREAELAAEQEAQLRAKLEEEEARRLARGKGGSSFSNRFHERVRIEREKQMQRVLMEKKQLDKTDLLAKQQPILLMKQMEKEKRKKQREKIRQQQKIFDKTVAMLFPEVVEKPIEAPSRMDEFEAEQMKRQSELMSQYDTLLPKTLKIVKDNPFNKRLKWEQVFEEGMNRRNVLDFPLYLRQKRKERYIYNKYDKKDKAKFRASQDKKGKVIFKVNEGEAGKTAEEADGEEEEEIEQIEEEQESQAEEPKETELKVEVEGEPEEN